MLLLLAQLILNPVFDWGESGFPQKAIIQYFGLPGFLLIVLIFVSGWGWSEHQQRKLAEARQRNAEDCSRFVEDQVEARCRVVEQLEKIIQHRSSLASEK
jgi:hypothetical protein